MKKKLKRAAIYSPEVDPYGIGLAYTFIVDHDLYLVKTYIGEDSLIELGEDAARGYFDVIIVKHSDVLAKDIKGLLAYEDLIPIPFVCAENLYYTGGNLDIETMEYEEPREPGEPGESKDDSWRRAKRNGMVTYAGVVVTENKNKKFSMGAVPFGFKKVNGRFVPDPDTVPWVRQIFNKALAGERYTAIASWLDQESAPIPRKKKSGKDTDVSHRWSDNTIRDILRNERYAQDGVISQELFDGVQARFSEHKKKLQEKPKTEENPRGLYQGLVFCESCGRPMTYQGVGVNRRKTAAYSCKHHMGKNPDGEALEHMPKIDEEDLKKEVLRQCNDYISYMSNRKNHFAVADRLEKKKGKLEKQIEGIGEKIIRNESVKNVEGLWFSWNAARTRASTAFIYLTLMNHNFKMLQIGHMDETDLEVERKLIESITVKPDGTAKVHFNGDWVFR